MIRRQSIDPTSFFIYPTAQDIIHDDAPPPPYPIERDYITPTEYGSIFHCYVQESLTVDTQNNWSLDLKATWTRSRDFAPFPTKAMKATKKLLTSKDYLLELGGKRTKSKKGKRRRSHRNKVLTIQEALANWASQFEEYSIHLKGELYEEQGKRRPKSTAFVVIEPSHLFSDVFKSRRLWFIQSTVRSEHS